MNYDSILQKIGLSIEQAQIYNVLIEHGEMSILEISHKSSLHRPKIYSILPSLLELSLVSRVPKGKRFLYAAEDPKNLMSIFDRTREEFSGTLQYLSKKYNEKKLSPTIKTIQGPRFSLAIFDDVLQSLGDGEMHYRYSSRQAYQDDVSYAKRRRDGDNQGIQCLSITNDVVGFGQEKSLNHEVKLLGNEAHLFDDNLSKVIYGNKVAIIDYNSNISYIIENEKFSQFEKKIFEELYKKL